MTSFYETIIILTLVLFAGIAIGVFFRGKP